MLMDEVMQGQGRNLENAVYEYGGGAVHANMGGLMPMLMDKAKEEGIPMGLASMLSEGGMTAPLSNQEQYKFDGGAIRQVMDKAKDHPKLRGLMGGK
jgi:hypothetical protein